MRSLAPTLDGFEPPTGSFLVMRINGKPVGCGGFKRDAPGIAYLKRMWVAREVRGLGLGRRLLAELEGRARALDYRKVRLETEKSLKEAQRLYRSSGYSRCRPSTTSVTPILVREAARLIVRALRQALGQFVVDAPSSCDGLLRSSASPCLAAPHEGNAHQFVEVASEAAFLDRSSAGHGVLQSR